MQSKILKRTDTDVLNILKHYREEYNIQSDIVNNLIQTLTEGKTSEVKERKKKVETI